MATADSCASRSFNGCTLTAPLIGSVVDAPKITTPIPSTDSISANRWSLAIALAQVSNDIMRTGSGVFPPPLASLLDPCTLSAWLTL